MKLEHLHKAEAIFNNLESAKTLLRDLENDFSRKVRLETPQVTSYEWYIWHSHLPRTSNGNPDTEHAATPPPAPVWVAPDAPIEAYKSACIASLKAKIEELEREVEAL